MGQPARGDPELRADRRRPDAPEEGKFNHWAIYDIPADGRELRQGESSETDLPQAMNHFGETRYDGPEPIAGHGPHHYRFILFALDVPSLEIPPNPSVQEVREAVSQHSIEDTQLVGRFERASKQM